MDAEPRGTRRSWAEQTLSTLTASAPTRQAARRSAAVRAGSDTRFVPGLQCSLPKQLKWNSKLCGS